MGIEPIESRESEGTGRMCGLCGGPNDCAQAARRPLGEGAERGGSPGEGEAPCWCVGRRFPPLLLERGIAIDGGAACICRRCLAAAEKG